MRRKIQFLVILYSILFSVCMLATFAAKAKVYSLDSVAAVVNNGIITTSQVAQQTAIMQAELQQAKVRVPPDAIIKKKVLQQLIIQTLQVQVAKHMGIKVSTSAVNLALRHIASQRKMTLTQLYQAVQQVGWTVPEFREQIKQQMVVEKLQQHAVVPRVSISPDEVSAFLRSLRNREQALTSEFHLQNILIPLPDTPTPNQIMAANKKAQKIIAKINAGASFHQLAVTESSGKRSLRGGDLGWRKLAELPLVFANRVQGMGVGDITGPIRTPNGVHVIKLLGKRKLNSAQRISRSQVEQMIFQRKLNAAIQAFVDNLRSQSYIKVMQK